MVQITKILTVNGYTDETGSKIPFIFGPDNEDEVLDDQTCIESVKEQVPNVVHAGEIVWRTERTADGNMIKRAELATRAQVKGSL